MQVGRDLQIAALGLCCHNFISKNLLEKLQNWKREDRKRLYTLSETSVM